MLFRSVCDESRVGALLYEDRLPISSDAKRLSRRDRRKALDHALSDGEDYELLFTLPAIQATRLEQSKLGRVIGEVTAADGLYLKGPGGALRELPRTGWQHHFRR